MKYSIKEDVNFDVICELRPGDIFIFENRPYIRVNDEFQYVYSGNSKPPEMTWLYNPYDYILAVDLRTGEFCHFNKSIRTRAVKDYSLDITV